MCGIWKCQTSAPRLVESQKTQYTMQNKCCQVMDNLNERIGFSTLQFNTVLFECVTE